MKILFNPGAPPLDFLKTRNLSVLETVWNEGCHTYPKIKVTFTVWKDAEGPIVRIFIKGKVWWIF